MSRRSELGAIAKGAGETPFAIDDVPCDPRILVVSSYTSIEEGFRREHGSPVAILWDTPCQGLGFESKLDFAHFRRS